MTIALPRSNGWSGRRLTGGSIVSTYSTSPGVKGSTRSGRSRRSCMPAQIGLFDMSWNVLCPSCGGVLDANTSLKNVRSSQYHCAFCNLDNEPTLDDMVEVSFTVSPRVRRIAAHNPDELPIWEYYRQVFWGTGVDLPEEDFEAAMQQLTLDAVELPAGDKALLSLQLPAGFVIVLEPVTHSAQFIEVKGEPTGERQNLALVYNNVRATTSITELRPGPLAALAGQPHRHARAARGLARRRRPERAHRQAPAVPDGQAPAVATRPSATSIAPTRSTSTSG